MTSSLPVMDILYLARLLAWLESYVWLQGVRDDDCHNVGRWRFARFGTRVLRSLRTHGLRRRAWTSVGYVMAAADIFAQLQFLHIFYRVSSPLSPQIKRAAQLNFSSNRHMLQFFFNIYETSHAQYFLSFLLLCTRFLGSRRRSPSGWMHFYTPPESSGISRNAIIGLGSLRSPAFKPHPIFTRTAHTECYTDRALCSDLLHFLSQPWVERHCHICTFIHRNLSSLNLLWDLLGFLFPAFLFL